MSHSYSCGVRIGNGYDVHALKEGLPMRLCGVDIPSEKGFVAHSDGDVAIHALCDALLGAAALGDIGLHFPDSDPRYKGIDSTKLLAEVVTMISGEGDPSGGHLPGQGAKRREPDGSLSPAATKYEICNVDITIALQAPKLRPYIDTMRETLAGIMNIDKSQVSVKATTTERLGFVGRGEGCEVWATVLIARNDIYQY